MTQKARVIITPTLICSRNCWYCCNHYEGLINAGVDINSLEDIPHRDTIMLTGGEPMEHVELTRQAIAKAVELGFKTIRLYTARFKDELYEFMPHLDGIHYTLHEGSTDEDIGSFMRMQFLAEEFPGKTYRAYIHPSITTSVMVTPSIWHRLEIKAWLSEEECPLPDGEVLYRMKVGNEQA
jgi:hypothetical protein